MISVLGTDVQHVFRGTFDSNWQYQYHMETENCLVIPQSDDLLVYPGTQNPDLTNTGLQSLLQIQENK